MGNAKIALGTWSDVNTRGANTAEGCHRPLQQLHDEAFRQASEKRSHHRILGQQR